MGSGPTYTENAPSFLLSVWQTLTWSRTSLSPSLQYIWNQSKATWNT